MSDLMHVYARIWLNRKDPQLWLLVRCPFRNPFAGFAYKSTPEEQLSMCEAMTRLSVDQNLAANILAAYADKKQAQYALALPELNHTPVGRIFPGLEKPFILTCWTGNSGRCPGPEPIIVVVLSKNATQGYPAL